MVFVESTFFKLNQYDPELRAAFAGPKKCEEFLPYFHFVDRDYKLSNEKTLIQDFYGNLDDAVDGAKKMLSLWDELDGRIDNKRFECTQENLKHYTGTAQNRRMQMIGIFERLTEREYKKINK